MHPALLQRLTGLLLVFSAAWLLPPLAVALLLDGAAHARPFALAALIEILAGAALYWPHRNLRIDLRVRDGFLIVVMGWLIFALSGALPMWLHEDPFIGFADGLFEAMSGLTTTGATVLTGLDDMPRGLLYLRSQLQWLGGMGIIVLAVAILPMLRIGGMQLFRAETPGPMKDNKLTPRIAQTAKALWVIYLVGTVCCAAAYWLAGMNAFDAVNHAFTTMPTGGFSTHDASLAHFQNPLIEIIAMLFMVVAGVNFTLHFISWRETSVNVYFQDAELRVYLMLLGIFITIVTLELLRQGIATDFFTALRLGTFHAISSMTTTGYTTSNFYLWAGFAPIFLIIIAILGGCAGSTAGGMKVVRILLLSKQMLREIRRLIHPNALMAIKYSKRVISDNIIGAIWAFFFLYVTTVICCGMLVHALGLDLVTAFSATIACLTNLGPALGEAGPNFASLSAPVKLVLAMIMLLGRLEIFTLLVLFTPAFWKH